MLENCKNSVLNSVEFREFIVRIIVLKCSLKPLPSAIAVLN
jgi:hypothetical protein